MQNWLDAGVIFGVVLVNAAIGFVQEGKAEDALRAIRDMLSATATVWRDGRLLNLDASELVTGDRVQLCTTSLFPRDHDDDAA